MYSFKKISIVTGHYGSGKTNISVNIAIQLAKQGKNVTIIDLDIVNPYFRTADFKDFLESNNVKVITPVYANTNLDIPALPASVDAILQQQDSYVVIDVGGDDAGAIALGRYANHIKNRKFDLFYVVNQRRFQTKSADEAIELLNDIQASARINATAIINNTNLGEQTTPDIIKTSVTFAKTISEKTNLPIAFTSINEKIEVDIENKFPVVIYITPFYS